MRKFRILKTVLSNNGGIELILVFLGYFFVSAFLISIVEPAISIGNSLWYCFTVVTTIGFGDVVVTTVISRILTVLLSLYAIFVIAIITGTVVSYTAEVQSAKKNESTAVFLEKMQRLDTLSQDELRDLSAKVKNFRLKNEK